MVGATKGDRGMIRDAIIGTAIAAMIPTGIYVADARYVSQQSFTQAIHQQRAWTLQDQIQAIRDNALYQNRQLSEHELSKIQQLETEIKRLQE